MAVVLELPGIGKAANAMGKTLQVEPLAAEDRGDDFPDQHGLLRGERAEHVEAVIEPAQQAPFTIVVLPALEGRQRAPPAAAAAGQLGRESIEAFQPVSHRDRRGVGQRVARPRQQVGEADRIPHRTGQHPQRQVEGP